MHFKMQEYFTIYHLGNLSPQLRSEIRSIQLLAVARATDVKKYGVDAILEPFMNDNKKLEAVT